QKYGLSFHDRLIGFLPRYAGTAARLPWLFNLRDAVPGAAALSEALIGFSARRPLPRWRSDYFRDDEALPLGGTEPSHGRGEPVFTSPRGGEVDPRRRRGSGEGVTISDSQLRSDPPHPIPLPSGEREQPVARFEPDVVLFVDTFNRYFERGNIDAALAVLGAAGYRVELARSVKNGDGRPLCCGRTFLSVGKVEEARREAERVLDALAPFVERGVPVVGLEPSCLFGFRDEIPALLKSRAAKRLAGQTF